MTKTILVTGGNQGMGLEMATELSELGQTVIIGSRSVEKGQTAVKQLAQSNLQIDFVQLDVTNRTSIDAAIQYITDEYGHLDTLINNAGIAVDDHVAPSQLSTEKMRQDFEVNFFGLVDMTQASLPLLKKAPEGRIINISSMMGSHVAALDPNSEVFGASATGYQASKSAANMFTIQLAKELKQSHVNISVNAVDPGIVATNFGGTPAQQSAARGAKSPKAGVARTIELATADHVTTASFTNTKGIVPW